MEKLANKIVKTYMQLNHYKNPNLYTNVLHILQVHPSGTQYLIFILNSTNVLEDFIASGTNVYVLGPLKDIVLVP